MMRNKTKRKILKGTVAGLFASSLGILVWGFLFPPALEMPKPEKQKFAVKQSTAMPSFTQLAPLLSKPLQQSLEPQQVKQTVVQDQAPRVNWPQLKVECVFFGKESKLAILAANNQKFTCAEGDKVMQILVVKILTDRVELSFRGESKTLSVSPDQPDGATK